MVKAKSLWQNKRGAMFGLDARIALTIFILLGVMVYAALGKVIKQLDQSRLLHTITQIDTAATAFELDTGYCPYQISRIAGQFGGKGSAAWQGPYYSFNSCVACSNNEYGSAEFLRRAKNVPQPTDALIPCTADDCQLILYQYGTMRMSRKRYMQALQGIELQMDGAIDGRAGRIRYPSSMTDGGEDHTNFQTFVFMSSPCKNGFSD